MSVMREVLLAGSTNPWLRDHATNKGLSAGRCRDSCRGNGARMRCVRRASSLRIDYDHPDPPWGKPDDGAGSGRSRHDLQFWTRLRRPGSTRRSPSSPRSSVWTSIERCASGTWSG